MKILSILFFIPLCHILVSDVTKRKILNGSVLALFFIGFLIFCTAGSFFTISLVRAVLFSLFIFMFFMFFYFFGIMGAGDVKFGAGLAFCFGFEDFIFIFLVSLIITLIYTFCSFFLLKLNFKRAFLKKGKNELSGRSKFIPYGAFLSLGAIIHLLIQVGNV